MFVDLPSRQVRIDLSIIYFLFFISGFSALCYQIVWQRMLFAAFGINAESVTIIVSVFMLGLGVGGIVGGNLQAQPKRLLTLFMFFECAIGLFGFGSPVLIHWLGTTIHASSLWAVGLGACAVFAIPTFLMGATLPILVSYVQNRVGLTSLALGGLYASNAMGAMLASGLTVTVLFVHFDQSDVLHLAITLNLITALLSFWFSRSRPGAEQQSNTTPTKTVTTNSRKDAEKSFSPQLLLFASFALGYITLSQELFWYRVLSFVTANRPETFGLLLAAFLFGIAMATITACNVIRQQQSVVQYIVNSLALATLIWFLAVPTIAALAGMGSSFLVFYVGLIFVAAVSYFTGGVFTALCHLLQLKLRAAAGKTVGLHYFANVIGATSGPLLTGFLLFEYFSVRDLVLLFGIMTLLSSMIFFPQLANPFRLKLGLMATGTLLLGFALHSTAYEGIMEKLQMVNEPFTAFTSNRSGFISAIGHKIYGNGVYDNTMNIDPDPQRDVNKIFRAYAIPTFHARPTRVLVIGTNGGSWTKALSMYGALQKLTTLEINRGYLDIIALYPDFADILHHPKVEFVIDDGRHWLNNNPDEKFDIIVSNAIYHWRSNATNLLSREFMELCRSRLNPGGYLYINDTNAEDVAFTAAHVFQYVTRAFNIMVIAGDSPPEASPEQKRANLAQFKYPDGSPVYKKQETIDHMVNITYPNQREAWLARQDLMLITDDNMATEFKKKPH